jgi:hypothetical protein
MTRTGQSLLENPGQETVSAFGVWIFHLLHGCRGKNVHKKSYMRSAVKKSGSQRMLGLQKKVGEGLKVCPEIPIEGPDGEEWSQSRF